MSFISIEKLRLNNNGLLIEFGKENKKYEATSAQEYDFFSINGKNVSPSSNENNILLNQNKVFYSHT